MTEEDRGAASGAAAVSSRQSPPCPFGTACCQTGLLHFADFSHQLAARDFDSWGVLTEATSSEEAGAADAAAGAPASATASPSGQLKRQDTMPIGEFLAAKRQRTKSGDQSLPLDREEPVKPLSRGLSLVREFSSMSHAERKALVAEAVAARLSLESRLRRAESRERRLADRLCAGLPALPEERDALREGKFLLVPLTPDRHYRPNSPQEVHYRIAEAQFHRLLARDCVGCFQVTKVEYVVSPTLLRQFRQFQGELMSTEGLCESDWQPVLAFHGTDEASIESICASGFHAPGSSVEYSTASDTGWYGRGIYFSEFPACAMDYVRGRSRLLLCMVLPGRCHSCQGLEHGQPPRPGHHSNRSPDGRELVAFSSGQALPAYVVHYRRTAADVDASAGAAAAASPADACRGQYDALHSLYFRASGLETRLLRGACVRVDGNSGGFGRPGLLLTRDQVARFCLAQGARVLRDEDGEEEKEAGWRRLITVRLVASNPSEEFETGKMGEVWSVAELLQRTLDAHNNNNTSNS